MTSKQEPQAPPLLDHEKLESPTPKMNGIFNETNNNNNFDNSYLFNNSFNKLNTNNQQNFDDI